MSADSNSHQNIPFSSDVEAIFSEKHVEVVRHCNTQSVNSGTLIVPFLFGTAR